MYRKDIIFCKLLSGERVVLGSFEAPVIINEEVLKHAFIKGNPPIMKTISQWLFQPCGSRMAVFTTKGGDSYAIMNTTRTSLTQKRTIDWLYVKTNPCEWLSGLNPIWVTMYSLTI